MGRDQVIITNVLTIAIWFVSIVMLQGQVIMGTTTGTIVTTDTTFYDSGGPSGNYANNENFSATFSSEQSTQQLTLRFLSFNLETQSNCDYDEILIYDGSGPSSPLIGRYCGTTIPADIQSSGQFLHVVFNSDFSETRQGWSAQIFAVDCSQNTYKDEFSTPNYDNSNGLTNWSNTSWIEVGENNGPSNGRIRISSGELQFTNVDGEKSLERAVDLTNASLASVSFELRRSGTIESNEYIAFDVYDGTTWTNLYIIYDDFSDRTLNFDLTPYANANTRIRFRANNSATSEFFLVNAIEICFSLDPPIVFLEAECGEIGGTWSTFADGLASRNIYLSPKAGVNSIASPPADTADYLRYTTDINEAGDYKIYGRVIAPTSDDDSFWLRVNGGPWYRWDNLSTQTSWTWKPAWDSDSANDTLVFTLPVGVVTLDIAHREDGVSLDKLAIALEGEVPSGDGLPAKNCPSLFGLDTDNDGIVDEEDLDDDNDGLLDVDESPATIRFDNGHSILIGTDTANMLVGHAVLYTNSIRDCDDQFYDVKITINTITPGATIEATSEGMIINNASAAEDDHFTFTLDVVESGSATMANPTGTPATISDFYFTPRDIDSNVDINHTEVFGISNSTAPTNITLDNNTVLEAGGFVNGGGPAGYTFFRMFPLSGANNWTANGNDVTGELPEHAVIMYYTAFSSVDIAFGRTGSASASNGGSRLTSLFASKECDRDGDGISNRIDLDLDNDGIFDLIEAGHGFADANDDGRIDGAETGSGLNGVFDGIETFADSDILNYTYSNSDGDLNVPDAFDLDSDDDGCFDTQEADVVDPEPDGTAGSGTATADVNGLVISIVYKPPPSNAWQDSTASCLEICGNNMDDDGDGLNDNQDPDCANYYLEAECGFPGANWNRGLDPLASNDDYLTITPGLNSTAVPPMGAADLLRFTVTVSTDGLYRILARVYSRDGADDSFWVSVDGGTWYNWNNWNTAETWQWLPISDSDNGNTLIKWNLTSGVHTIDIAYREDGARLDKLHLTINGNTPTDEGEDAINCGRTITYNLFLPYKKINRVR